MELFCKYLPKEEFEVFAVSRLHRPPTTQKIRVSLGALVGHKKSIAKQKLWRSMNARIPNFQSILGPDKVRFAESDQDLRKIILEIGPDILHVHYSGNSEPPISDPEIMKKVPAVITTNQFEKENVSPSHQLVRRILFVSNWLLQNKATWAKNDPRTTVVYNPVEKPLTNDDLRSELGISKDTFVIGRVGRPDPGIHDPISLDAYARIETDKTLFLALSPPDNMVAQARELKLKNFRVLPPTPDPLWLSKFYNTIDVLAHARKDGETFGCNIAEAMVHGKPVVSHISRVMDAQTEVIGNCGYIAPYGDQDAYAEYLRQLRDNSTNRSELARQAKQRALDEFEAERLTLRLSEIYKNELAKPPR